MTDISEAYISRDGSDGENYRREIIAYTFNEANESTAAGDALAWFALNFPTYDGLPARSMRREQVTSDVFKFTMEYGLEQNQVQPSNPDAGEFNAVFGFNFIGGTVHITTALETTSYAKSGRNLVDAQKTIGLDLKSGQVRGVDVFAPVSDFSLTTQFPNHVITRSYAKAVKDLVGKVNDAPFWGNDTGTVLFKGARGTRKGASNWEIAFEFASDENVNPVEPIGSGDEAISYVNKPAWHYLDPWYTDSTTLTINGKPIQVPIQVNVHKVYKSGSFSVLRIGS